MGGRLRSSQEINKEFFFLVKNIKTTNKFKKKIKNKEEVWHTCTCSSVNPVSADRMATSDGCIDLFRLKCISKADSWSGDILGGSISSGDELGKYLLDMLFYRDCVYNVCETEYDLVSLGWFLLLFPFCLVKLFSIFVGF